MVSGTPIRPFHSGTQYMDWLASNCDCCAKAGACELENALQSAACDDGTVSPVVASRLRCDPHAYVWMCGEWEATKRHIRTVVAMCKLRNRAKAQLLGTKRWLREWIAYPLVLARKTKQWAEEDASGYGVEDGTPFGWRTGYGIARSIYKPDRPRAEWARIYLRKIANEEADRIKD